MRVAPEMGNLVHRCIPNHNNKSKNHQLELIVSLSKLVLILKNSNKTKVIWKKKILASI